MNDCYFYTTKKEDGETYVVPLCVACHVKYPKLGWFWAGSEKGYGPFLFECEKCKGIIHQPNDETETTASAG